MKTILEEAAEITSASRQYDYGDARANHTCAAELKAAYRKRRAQITEDFDAVDHCIEMILVKIARIAHRRKRDSFVDVVGYVLNAEEMLREEWVDRDMPVFIPPVSSASMRKRGLPPTKWGDPMEAEE